jgi:hypothetical protein
MLPELVGLNRLPAQATTYPYPDEEMAAKNRREVCPWYLPLDGRWRFRLMPNPRHEDAPLADAALDDVDWAGIEVPGCWTMQGFDPPIYLNVRMPFDNLAPRSRRTTIRRGGTGASSAFRPDGAGGGTYCISAAWRGPIWPTSTVGWPEWPRMPDCPPNLT